MKVKSYKELHVWKKGIDIVDSVYSIAQNLPENEQYGLASQIRRSAVSVPSNIAEGFARGHTAEYRQFLRVALGSCAELETQLIICQRRGYVTEKVLLSLQEELDHESRMIMNLIKSLGENKKP
ncbi:MAG: four helix bundle protein [Planctomycetota bacterium]|jgi:four helix bundle protein